MASSPTNQIGRYLNFLQNRKRSARDIIKTFGVPVRISKVCHTQAIASLWPFRASLTNMRKHGIEGEPSWTRAGMGIYPQCMFIHAPESFRISFNSVFLIYRDGDRKPVQTGLSIAVNQSKTEPPSKRFGFLCMHRVPGGVIKLSAPTFSLASQCLPSATIKQPFQNLSSLVPCPLSLCSEATWA